MHGIASIAWICRCSLLFLKSIAHAFPLDYIPVYFQAVLGASSIRSGVESLPGALLIAFFALACGAAVQIAQKYRPWNMVGWMTIIAGFGIASLLKAEASTAQWVGYQVVLAIGFGIIVRMRRAILKYSFLTRFYD